MRHSLRAAIFGVGLTCLAGGIIIAQAVTPKGGNPEAAKIKNPVPATPESIKKGKELFEKHCTVCHGQDGTGGTVGDYSPLPGDFTSNDWVYGSSDGEVFSVTKNGVLPTLYMANWGDRLSDTEIWNVVNYVKTFRKK